jgi:hypothetical protein
LEKLWRIPDMRSAAYWIICDIGFVVDGQAANGRATRGFDGDPAKLPTEQRHALLTAIDQAIATLPPAPAFVPVVYRPNAGHMWRYKVTVEPALWTDARLTYRTVQRGDAIGVTTEFSHAGGQMNFDLGVFAPMHPSHANVRFPGFFFHPAYFDRPLEIGQRFSWQWPWQLNGQVRAGRIKRYAGTLTAWEDIAFSGGRYPAARIEATLDYIDEGRVQASSRETIWYMPAVRQVAKVVRDGRTPDEGATRIVAELLEYK